MRKLYVYEVCFIDDSSETVTGHEAMAVEGILYILWREGEKAPLEDSVVFTAAPGQWKFVRRLRTAVAEE